MLAFVVLSPSNDTVLIVDQRWTTTTKPNGGSCGDDFTHESSPSRSSAQADKAEKGWWLLSLALTTLLRWETTFRNFTHLFPHGFVLTTACPGWFCCLGCKSTCGNSIPCEEIVVDLLLVLWCYLLTEWHLVRILWWYLSLWLSILTTSPYKARRGSKSLSSQLLLLVVFLFWRWCVFGGSDFRCILLLL